MLPAFSPACGGSRKPIGRPSGFGMNMSSSLGSGVVSISIGVGFGSGTGRYKQRADVKLLVDIRFMIVRCGVRVFGRKHADETSRRVRRNGTAILGCNMFVLW